MGHPMFQLTFRNPFRLLHRSFKTITGRSVSSPMVGMLARTVSAISDTVPVVQPTFYPTRYPGAVWPYPWTGFQYPPDPSRYPQPQLYQPSPGPQRHDANANSKSIPAKTRPPSPSPPPSPVYHPHWDAALKAFLVRVWPHAGVAWV